MASDLDEAVSFSWSDSFRALVAPCLSCLRTSPAHSLPTHDSSVPHLEALLADARSGHSSSSLADGETLSLHSSIGDTARRQRRKRGFGLGAAKHIRLWGWDLFGKPRGAIRLPEDDDLDEPAGSRMHRPSTHSSSTLASDAISDASPLDAGAIASHVHTLATAEEEARAKAERKARRRERKAAKAAALALVQGDGNTAFEGFQGSGSNSSAPPTPFTPMLSPPATATGNPLADMQMQRDDEEEEMGDFGASAYVRPRPRSTGGSGSGSHTRSHSQSLSSGSHSRGNGQDGTQYNHQFVSQQPQASALHPAVPHTKTKKRRDSKSASSRSSHSHSSSRSYTFSQPTQDSASLASPPAAAPPQLEMHLEEQFAPFEGFPDDLHLGFPARGFVPAETGKAEFPSPGLGGGGGFPSTGFGGVKRDAGAFLARRGDDL